MQTLRERRGLTNAKFAQITNLQVSIICHLEAQKFTPYPSQARKIAMALERDVPLINLFQEMKEGNYDCKEM